MRAGAEGLGWCAGGGNCALKSALALAIGGRVSLAGQLRSKERLGWGVWGHLGGRIGWY